MIKYAKKDNFYSIFPMGEIPKDWEELTKEEYDKHFEKSLSELKSEKLAELSAITSRFDNQLVNNEMIIKSSLGFSINADLRSQNNLRGLISLGVEPVNFMTADNSVQSLSIEQLNVLLNETAQNGENLYKTKWELRNRILNSSSVEELNSIKFNFVMLDFSVS